MVNGVHAAMGPIAWDEGPWPAVTMALLGQRYRFEEVTIAVVETFNVVKRISLALAHYPDNKESKCREESVELVAGALS